MNIEVRDNAGTVYSVLLEEGETIEGYVDNTIRGVSGSFVDLGPAGNPAFVQRSQIVSVRRV